MNLRIPGPTPCPPEVLEAMARPMIDHRGRPFAALMQGIGARLKEFFRTKDDVLVLTASGTGGMEAAVVNTLSPGDKVLAVSVGAFGDRFARIAEAHGAQVVRLSYEWGQTADAEDVRRALREDAEIAAILITHNETSTGVTNPLAEIARAVREVGAVREPPLLLVDAISSLGAIPLESDEWGLDVVVTASQKGWMVPPGLAFVSMSERAWKAYEKAKMPRFYFDLGEHREWLAKGQTPWTPAVSIVYGLAVALEQMAAEGLPAIWERHARLGRLTREGVKALGLELLAGERFASNTVTAVVAPAGVEVKALRNLLEDELDVVVAGGQGKLSGSIFRIGHLGWVSEEDMREALAGLEKALSRLGYSLPAYR